VRPGLQCTTELYIQNNELRGVNEKGDRSLFGLRFEPLTAKPRETGG
jgi:hypothetical protein